MDWQQWGSEEESKTTGRHTHTHTHTPPEEETSVGLWDSLSCDRQLTKTSSACGVKASSHASDPGAFTVCVCVCVCACVCVCVCVHLLLHAAIYLSLRPWQ